MSHVVWWEVEDLEGTLDQVVARVGAVEREHEQTVGAYLNQVVRDARRRERLQSMADSMRENPPGSDYWAEVSEWDQMTEVPRG